MAKVDDGIGQHGPRGGVGVAMRLTVSLQPLEPDRVASSLCSDTDELYDPQTSCLPLSVLIYKTGAVRVPPSEGCSYL